MRHLPSLLLVVAIIVAAQGCDGSAPPTAPNSSDAALASRSSATSLQLGGDSRLVTIMDACDPTSFNAALGAGSCARQGGVPFDVFIAQLTKHQFAGAWHFAPAVVNVQLGQTLIARNNGGEVHTFTEVENFGGGIVPLLNELSGNPDPAPECLALTGSDFIPPGGTASDDEDESGTELYQCCIHPWMRTVVHVGAN
jgi:plastocyanin